jgi:carboxymethylenebutenolidase
MIEDTLAVATADGVMQTFLARPERGPPRPLLIFYMDAPGIREELRDMARRLAATGYCVALPNLYYREGVMELGAFTGAAGAAVRTRMMALMGTLTIPMVMADTDALLAAVGGMSAQGPMGCLGYCMSGQYAVNAAARHPDRVRAAASLYGVRLVTDEPDSPHRAAARSRARLYFACAEHDSYAPLDMVRTLDQTLRAHGADAEVEIYPGVEHGFAFPGRPAYDRAAAERHWERLHALFDGTLRAS